MLSEVTFSIPQLVTRSAVGAGCCAVPAEDLIRRGVERLEGVAVVAIDQPGGRIDVAYDSGRVSTELLVETLAGLGYPAAPGGCRRKEVAPREELFSRIHIHEP